MTFRKRHQPTPAFRLPPPYQPITGERHHLAKPGVFPHCAMMQIVETDTNSQYVKCRGYDPRIDRTYHEDYGTVSVGKPYQKRFPGVYRVGEVYPALLPLMAGAEESGIIVPRIGQNVGRVTGDDKRGNPLPALDEEIVHLVDDEGTFINWFLMDGGLAHVYFELKVPYVQWTTEPVNAWIKIWDPTAQGGKGGFTTCGDEIKVADFNEVGHNTTAANGYGCGIMHETEEEPYWACVIHDLCCPGDEKGEC